jgi:hypothetical protein
MSSETTQVPVPFADRIGGAGPPEARGPLPSRSTGCR